MENKFTYLFIIAAMITVIGFVTGKFSIIDFFSSEKKSIEQRIQNSDPIVDRLDNIENDIVLGSEFDLYTTYLFENVEESKILLNFANIYNIRQDEFNLDLQIIYKGNWSTFDKERFEKALKTESIWEVFYRDHFTKKFNDIDIRYSTTLNNPDAIANINVTVFFVAERSSFLIFSSKSGEMIVSLRLELILPNNTILAVYNYSGKEKF